MHAVRSVNIAYLYYYKGGNGSKLMIIFIAGLRFLIGLPVRFFWILDETLKPLAQLVEYCSVYGYTHAAYEGRILVYKHCFKLCIAQQMIIREILLQLSELK